MRVELIPVIEIGYYNQGITLPDKSPYWKYPDEWQCYHDECYEKAGFTDKFIPYAKGSSFYRASDISDNNLLKIINDHLSFLEEPEASEEQVCALDGGYVLKIDGKNKLFPQCCADLSDIVCLKALNNRETPVFDNGHPCPTVFFSDEHIIFQCTDEFEPFVPETDEEITVSFDAFKIAYREAIAELDIFINNLKRIEHKLEHKTIKPLVELLIYNQ